MNTHSHSPEMNTVCRNQQQISRHRWQLPSSSVQRLRGTMARLKTRPRRLAGRHLPSAFTTMPRISTLAVALVLPAATMLLSATARGRVAVVAQGCAPVDCCLALACRHIHSCSKPPGDMYLDEIHLLKSLQFLTVSVCVLTPYSVKRGDIEPP
jgi:hypothetical protein